MAVRTVPPGVTCGEGVVNFVNVKFTGINRYLYAYWVHPWNDVANGRRPHMVFRHADLNTCYAAIVGRNPPYEDDGDFTFDKTLRAAAYSAASGFYYIFENPNVLLNDLSTNATTHGTASYVAGTAPVPTDHCRYVGVGQTYSSIYDAVVAAEHGDNIIIEPGTYACGEFGSPYNIGYGAVPGYTIGKCVRFYGATERASDVVLYTPWEDAAAHFFYWRPWNMTNVPVEFRGPGFFHLTLKHTSLYYWQNMVSLCHFNTPDANPWNPGTPDYVGHCPGDNISPVCAPRSTSRSCAGSSVIQPWIRCT